MGGPEPDPGCAESGEPNLAKLALTLLLPGRKSLDTVKSLWVFCGGRHAAL
jgi:hypothetical protein